MCAPEMDVSACQNHCDDRVVREFYDFASQFFGPVTATQRVTKPDKNEHEAFMLLPRLLLHKPC